MKWNVIIVIVDYILQYAYYAFSSETTTSTQYDYRF